MKIQEYYSIREGHKGRERKLTPRKVFELANAYFDFVQNNPLQEEQAIKRKISRDEEIIEKITVSKMRAMSDKGFCVFADIAIDTFYKYAKDPRYAEIIAHIKAVIDTAQFEGASANMLNASIISQTLGLTAKQHLEVEGDVKTNAITEVVITRRANNED